MILHKDDKTFSLLPDKQQAALLRAIYELERDEGLHDYNAAAEFDRLTKRLDLIDKSVTNAPDIQRSGVVQRITSSLQTLLKFSPQAYAAITVSFFAGAVSVGIGLNIFEEELTADGKAELAVVANSTTLFRGAADPIVDQSKSRYTKDKSESDKPFLAIDGNTLQLPRSAPAWRQIVDVLDSAGHPFSLQRTSESTLITVYIAKSDQKTVVLRVLLALPPNFEGFVQIRLDPV